MDCLFVLPFPIVFLQHDKLGIKQNNNNKKSEFVVLFFCPYSRALYVVIFISIRVNLRVSLLVANGGISHLFANQIPNSHFILPKFQLIFLCVSFSPPYFGRKKI